MRCVRQRCSYVQIGVGGNMRSSYRSEREGRTRAGAACFRLTPPPARRRVPGSGHRMRGLADGEQRVACRLIRANPVSMALCVPRVPRGAVSTNCWGLIYLAKNSASAAETVQTRAFSWHTVG